MNVLSSSPRPPIATGFAEPREAAPKVAILDDFDGDESGFPHGQAVESVLLSNSDLQPSDVQRMQNAPAQARIEDIMRTHKVDFRAAYGAAVMRNVAKFYLTTTQNLQTILKEQPTVKVIGQSQSDSAARMVGDMLSGLESNEAMRRHACESFGLAPDAPLPELLEALVGEAQSVITDNPKVDEARELYMKASRDVQERGITYLVAGGNHGDLAYVLEQKKGIKTGGGAYKNIFATEYATVVGALSPEGKESYLNSPGSGSEVWALGEQLAYSVAEGFDVSGKTDGTSFATPIVAGKVVKMLEADPSLTPFDIEAKLQGLDSTRVSHGEIKATANGQSLIADGSLEPYISERLGEGFVTDIYGETAQQLAQARQERTFFGLPGKADHEFQLVRVSNDPDGVRQLWVDSYFNEGHHVLRAKIKDGAWDSESVVEELHLDPKRQKEIDSRPAPTPAA